MNNSMQFPQEILHYIVDFVRDDQPTLAALRLLSHAWNISASPHLFRSVDLTIPVPPTRRCSHAPKQKFTGIDRFNALLSLLESSNDNISHCVRQVILGRARNFDPAVVPQGLERQQNDYAVLISSIVSRFTRMTDILFREINWSLLTPSFSSCILRICKSPTLESIDFWSCSMPTASPFLDLLQASSNLKALRLSMFKIDNIDLLGSKQHPLAPSSSSSSSESRHRHQLYGTNIATPLLHTLSVDSTSVPIVLPHIFKSSKLKQLNWGFSNDSISESGTEFLKILGQSLKSLVIKFIPELSTFQLNLSHCPRIQHLRISGLHWSPSVCPSTYFCSIFAGTPDQSLPIERLELVVYSLVLSSGQNEGPPPLSSAGLEDSCPPALYQRQHNDSDHGDHHHHRPRKLRYSGWLLVDSFLSRSRIFQSLKTLHISIRPIRERDVDLSNLSDTFPKLKNKGVQVMCTTY